MPETRLDFDAFYDEVHAHGLDHLQLLADTAAALRQRMADVTTMDEQFACTHHILGVSQAMLQWSHYLIPKEEHAPQDHCAECEAHEEDESTEE